MSAMNVYPDWDPSLYQAQAQYNARAMQLNALAHANGRRAAAAQLNADEDLDVDLSGADENAKKRKSSRGRKPRRAASKGRKPRKAASKGRKPRKTAGKKRGAKRGTHTKWHTFLKKHSGMGHTLAKLGQMYRKAHGLVKSQRTGRVRHRNAEGAAEDADFSVSHMNGPSSQFLDDFVDPFDLAPMVPMHTNGRRAFAMAAEDDDEDLELSGADENAKRGRKRGASRGRKAKRSTSKGRKTKRAASKGRKPRKTAAKKGKKSSKRASTPYIKFAKKHLLAGKTMKQIGALWRASH